jgi:hypothetical protein
MTVTLQNTTTANNYNLTNGTNYNLNGQSITPATLTIDNVGVAGKVYDGTATATFTGTPALVSVIPPDNVTLSGGTPTFADKNAGNGKAISFSPAFSLGGAQAGNYTLTPPSGVTANITAKDISVIGVTVAPKIYDGTSDATVTDVSFSGLENGESFANTDYSIASATFDSPNTGIGKTVQVTVTLENTPTAGNYNLTNGNPYNLTGQTIGRANIMLINATIAPKTYDGGVSATVTDVTFSNLSAGESLILNTDYTVTASFTDPNAGIGNRTVRLTVTLLNTSTAGKYSLNVTDYDLTGQSIAKAIPDLEALGVTADLSQAPVKITVPANVVGLGDITVKSSIPGARARMKSASTLPKATTTSPQRPSSSATILSFPRRRSVAK